MVDVLPFFFLNLLASSSPAALTSRSETSGASGIGGEIDFQPDFVWIKNRTSGYSHQLQDSNRGFVATKVLSTNQTAGEGVASATGDNYGHMSGVEANGFTVTHTINSNNDGGTIRKGTHFLNDTYVAWNWKADGSASTIAVDSVSSGVPSIASSVSANTDAGFSIVTYSGNADADATIGHGLGKTPKIIFVKQRDEAGNWIGFTETTGKDNKLNLNETTGSATSALWNNADPTPTVFSVKDTSSEDTFGDGHTYVAYCFADVEGYSKIGSYTGNGATSGTAGTYVYLGFRPSFVMLKSTGTGSWWMLDSTRDPFNEALRALQANAPADEEAYSGNFLDFYSNGFAPRTSGAQVNAAGTTYIYMAFAEAPFKYATAK